MNQMDHLQQDLRQTAAALLLEAGASAMALALEEDPDGCWIAVGPKSHIPFLFGDPKVAPGFAGWERGTGRVARGPLQRPR